MTRYRQRGHRHPVDKPQVAHQNGDKVMQDDLQNHQNGVDDGLLAEMFATTDEAGALCRYFFMPPKILNFLLLQLVLSRIFLLIFQCCINWIMLDAPTDAFKGIQDGQEDVGLLNWLIRGTLGGLSCWDARHFMHIAEFGYLWEHSLAFFPLFPVVLRLLGQLVQLLLGHCVSLFSAMLLSGVVLNNVLFVLNGLLLFRLVLLLNGGNLKEAVVVVYMHCWCPASVFYSALYAESLYASLTLLGLLHLYSSNSGPSGGSGTLINHLIASAMFAFAFLTRSNGLTNAGFVGFQLLLDALLCQSPADGQLEFRDWSRDLAKRLLRNFLLFLLCFSLMSLPVRVFEFAVRDKFCSLRNPAYVVDYADARVVQYLRVRNATSGLVLPGQLEKMPWCNDSLSMSSLLLPSYYAHIQQHYWDLGLFAYWQWRKLPLFLIAAPTLGFALYGVFKQTIGLLATDLRPIPDILADRRSLLPFALHTLFMALSGLFFYNVEVSIRLLFSASPFLYMTLAKIVCAQTPHIQRPEELMHSPLLPFLTVYAREGLGNTLLLFYLLAFFIFGTMAHVNWFPFV